MDKKRIIIRTIEFFVIGLFMGIVEDIIAIKIATNAIITFNTIKVAFIVALPFAIITELVADPISWKILLEEFRKQNKKVNNGQK